MRNYKKYVQHINWKIKNKIIDFCFKIISNNNTKYHITDKTTSIADIEQFTLFDK